MDKKGKKRGFAGLSDLTSEVNAVDDAVSSELKLEAKQYSTIHDSPSSFDNHRKEPDRKSKTSPPSIETISSCKRSGGSGWKWIIVIVGIIVVIWIFNIGGQKAKIPSVNTTSSTHNTSEARPNRRTLAQEIKNGKIIAKQMEVQIKEMDERLEDYERRMISYQTSDMIDEYIIIFTTYNSLVSERNELYKKYSDIIDEVNYKVKRYNSGYR